MFHVIIIILQESQDRNPEEASQSLPGAHVYVDSFHIVVSQQGSITLQGGDGEDGDVLQEEEDFLYKFK